MKIDWVRKLSSRKFWSMVSAFVVGMVIYFGGTQERATAIEGLIMAFGSVVVYILAETATDISYAPQHLADNNDESD